MPWAAAAATVVGGLLASDSASSAADAQRKSGEASLALQKQIYDQTRGDLGTYRTHGDQASNKLATLLGLGNEGKYLGGVESQDAIANRLRNQFTSTSNSNAPLRASWQPGGTPESGQQRGGNWIDPVTGQVLPPDFVDPSGNYTQQGLYGLAGMRGINPNNFDPNDPAQMAKLGTQTTSTDQSGLNSAVQAELARQAGQPGAVANPEYGSLLQNFTGKDLASEPGYQFGLKQGQNTIQNSAVARGGLFSGATLKALNQFGQDYGGTKFGEAFNRDAANKTRTYNFLGGVAQSGQNAANQTGTLGASYSANAGNTMTGIGNANASGIVGSGNAINSAIGQGVNAFTQNNMLRQSGFGGSGNTDFSQPQWSTTGSNFYGTGG